MIICGIIQIRTVFIFEFVYYPPFSFIFNYRYHLVTSAILSDKDYSKFLFPKLPKFPRNEPEFLLKISGVFFASEAPSSGKKRPERSYSPRPRLNLKSRISLLSSNWTAEV